MTIYSEAQNLENFGLSIGEGLKVETLLFSDSSQVKTDDAFPLFSFELNGKYHQSDDVNASLAGTRFILNFEESLKITFRSFGGNHPGWKGEIKFENQGFDTIEICNVLPFGENPENVYITGKGPWDLARAWLHRPGYDPVRVILPDNAWELGYSSIRRNNGLSICALIRRGSNEGAIIRRYSTFIPPGSRVTFNFYGEKYSGEWQNGLRKIFQERYLYDLYEFDNSLYERDDLKWIRHSYLIALQFAWDRNFYDRFEGKYHYGEVIKEANRIFGHFDVYGIWPTWPRLGVDNRNQWDMYSDLPGGTEQLRNFARLSRLYGTKFFIAFNPWDLSTRAENPLSGMARLIHETEADGVVLDTRGRSSYELQGAADSVREGVVMFSEGMAVTKDMPGIVSGRVHNAIFLSPEINLNKLIKPEFAIFRVCDVGEAVLHREIAIAFFNGYGTELNLFRAGRDHQISEDYAYLARTTMILRENSNAFLDKNWTPLISTKDKNVQVNRWTDHEKTIYTVLTMNSEGSEDSMFEVYEDSYYHFYSLWHNKEVTPVSKAGKLMVPVSLLPYPKSFKGSRKEGEVDCIARFPKLISSIIKNDTLLIGSSIPGIIRIWKGNPSYAKEKFEVEINNDKSFYLPDITGNYEGKIVIQLFIDGSLADANAVYRTGGIPWLISRIEKTEPASRTPRNMVLVPGDEFNFRVSANDNFIVHPATPDGINIKVDSFFIDKYPVTNLDFYRFIMATNYFPADTSNYLKHWIDGIYGQGREKYPVVYVSLEDARAYSGWAEKRLPSEAEWQLAAQGTDGREWPWGNEFHGTKCNNSFDRSTPVDAFSKGKSPYSVFDMVGNVWQIINDVYDNGTHYFLIIRGGSFYKPTSSWWYVQGGPQPLNKSQMLLMVSPGFDRNATVGFRCVKDFSKVK
ncbi:MAG: formylglycine-generating enzyme family protein [Bacteroidales bacterium]|nr:formylglycine-generating enzyme family protein [Bacteroidales bacterium]